MALPRLSILILSVAATLVAASTSCPAYSSTVPTKDQIDSVIHAKGSYGEEGEDYMLLFFVSLFMVVGTAVMCAIGGVILNFLLSLLMCGKSENYKCATPALAVGASICALVAFYSLFVVEINHIKATRDEVNTVTCGYCDITKATSHCDTDYVPPPEERKRHTTADYFFYRLIVVWELGPYQGNETLMHKTLETEKIRNSWTSFYNTKYLVDAKITCACHGDNPNYVALFPNTTDKAEANFGYIMMIIWCSLLHVVLLIGAGLFAYDHVRGSGGYRSVN